VGTDERRAGFPSRRKETARGIYPKIPAEPTAEVRVVGLRLKKGQKATGSKHPEKLQVDRLKPTGPIRFRVDPRIVDAVVLQPKVPVGVGEHGVKRMLLETTNYVFDQPADHLA
jgi:hypothetical protein